MGQGSIATVMGKEETKKQKNRLNIISTEQLDKYLQNRMYGHAKLSILIVDALHRQNVK
jgi:hypothetical protein